MTFRFAAWEGAQHCTGGPTPGAAALLAWCKANRCPPGQSLGIYNCRSVRGSTTTSLHGEGRALDWGLPVGPDGKGIAEGHDLVNLLGANGDQLGIQSIIYDRTIWSARSPGGRPYEGVHPHYDHLHIELNWKGARELTLATLAAVLGGTVERPLDVAGALAFNQRQGFAADEIELIQRLCGCGVTGAWDEPTVLAVAAWQGANAIPVDGRVWNDPNGNTWPRMHHAALQGLSTPQGGSG